MTCRSQVWQHGCPWGSLSTRLACVASRQRLLAQSAQIWTTSTSLWEEHSLWPAMGRPAP